MDSTTTIILTFDCVGHKVFQLVQFADRSFGVLCDDRLVAGYQWPETQWEEAVRGTCTLIWSLTRTYSASCIGCPVGQAKNHSSLPVHCLNCWSEM
jgi:hypothetical protein